MKPLASDALHHSDTELYTYNLNQSLPRPGWVALLLQMAQVRGYPPAGRQIMEHSPANEPKLIYTCIRYMHRPSMEDADTSIVELSVSLLSSELCRLTVTSIVCC